MTIEEVGRVDLVSMVKGIPHLLITDVGAIASAEERNTLYRKKLETYKDFIGSEEFQSKYPNWQNAVIELVSPVEPNDEMRKIGSVKIDSCDRSCEVKVLFRMQAATLG